MAKSLDSIQRGAGGAVHDMTPEPVKRFIIKRLAIHGNFGLMLNRQCATGKDLVLTNPF
jgi:hypothetical protein